MRGENDDGVTFLMRKDIDGASVTGEGDLQTCDTKRFLQTVKHNDTIM